MKYFTGIEGDERLIEIEDGPDGLTARIGEKSFVVDLTRVRGQSWYSLLVDGKSHDLHVRENGQAVSVSVGPYSYRVEVEDERMRAAREATGAAGGASGPEVVASVMPGIVRSVAVEAGGEVKKGDPLLILEAMKMQNEIRSPRDAIVEKVHVGADTVVAKGDALVTLAAVED